MLTLTLQEPHLVPMNMCVTHCLCIAAWQMSDQESEVLPPSENESLPPSELAWVLDDGDQPPVADCGRRQHAVVAAAPPQVMPHLAGDLPPPLAEASDEESLPSSCGSELGPRRVRRCVPGAWPS